MWLLASPLLNIVLEDNILFLIIKVKVKVAQWYLTLCDPMGYKVHGILQARILEWVAFPFSRGSSQPRDRTQVSRFAGGFFTSWATREAQEYWSGCCVLSRLVVSDSCHPIDCSLPGSSIHGLLQAKILEWVAYPFSRWYSWPRNQTRVFRIAGGFFTNWAIREAQIAC